MQKRVFRLRRRMTTKKAKDNSNSRSPSGMTSKKGKCKCKSSRNSKIKIKIKIKTKYGGLSTAQRDRTVRCFGRDDAVFSVCLKDRD